VNVDDRYPVARAALQRLLGGDGDGDRGGAAPPLAAFRVGPAVLRAPAPRARAAPGEAGDDGEDDGDHRDGAHGGEDLLGELVDMVLVGADDSDSRHPEVHLQFKADVFGGLHLRLQKTPEGLVARFTVADAAARRAVVGHVDDLLARLRGRGFAVHRYDIDVS
jgi:hypothetical protein